MSRYAAQAERLTALLGLRTPPVAVLFGHTRPDGLESTDAVLKGCMFLDVARETRRALWAEAANLAACPGGRHYLGLGDAFAKLVQGDFPADDWPDKGLAVMGNAKAFRATYPHYAIMPRDGMAGLGFGPLAGAPFGPEHGRVVVALFLTAKQGMYLARCATYESGGVVEGPIGPPTCSIVLTRPALTGRPTYTLGCYGFRHYVRIGADEVVFGLPLERLDETVAGLERFMARRPDYAAMLTDEARREADIARVHAGTDRLRPYYARETAPETPPA